MENKKIKVACFGEILWDIFPGEKRRIGGAPFNVAYHLHQMGLEVHMISAVGDDAYGAEALQQMDKWHISTQGIQILADHPTSTVVAHIDEHNDAHYDIIDQVAWDFMEAKAQDHQILSDSQALVFGTLAARNPKTRNTLFELLESSSYNVFDINLRAPYYNVNLIKDLLHKTQLAKFNKAELRMMLDFLGKTYTDESDSIHYIQDTFDMPEIIVSKGSKGALYANAKDIYFYPTVAVQVKDTVGSGDSFLAGFLSKRLEKTYQIHNTMIHAVSLGAFITSQEGACPEYTPAMFQAFRDAHPIDMDL